MLYLLSKEQKNKISQEYRVRFLIVAFTLVFVGEIISLILLVPPYLTAETRINLLNEQSASLKAQNVTTETSKLTDVVRQTNTYLNIFNSSSAPTGVVSVIQNIISTRGSAILMNSFVYKAQNGQQQIIVHGTASSRQALLDFVKKIKIQPGVVSADLPVSDFAKAANIDFSITILVNPQKI